MAKETKEVVEKITIDKDDELEEEEILSLEDRILNIEKKTNNTFVISVITLVISCIILLLVATIDGGNANTTSSTGESTGAQDSLGQEMETTYDASMFDEIKGSEIKSLSKNKTIVLWIGRQGCGYCASYSPIIAGVKDKYKVDIKYIDYSKMVNISAGAIVDEESYSAIESLTGSGDYENYGKTAITGTPYTLVIKNNKIIGALRGSNSEDSIVKMLKETKVIK